MLVPCVFRIFPMLSRVTWCYDISIVSSLNCGCMMFWWMCLMVLWCFVWHSIQDGVQVLITHNLRIGVLDILPPILSRALAGKRHWATQGTQGCLVNFFCRPRRHSEDASQNLQTYKRCGRRNMLDQGHDMVWRTERESFAFGMDCNIFLNLDRLQRCKRQAVRYAQVCIRHCREVSSICCFLAYLKSWNKSQEFARQFQPVGDAATLDGSLETDGLLTCSFSVGAMENDPNPPWYGRGIPMVGSGEYRT